MTEFTFKVRRPRPDEWDVFVDRTNVGWIISNRTGFSWSAFGAHGSGISLHDCSRQIEALDQTRRNDD